jgi:hypothetical protein
MIITGEDITNEAYHANKSHLSSSSLKLLLESPQQFYREHVQGIRPQPVENPNFDIGSYTHSLILEPEKMAHYAVFSGLRKAGQEWETFKAAHAGKTILSAPQVHRAKKLHTAYQARPEAIKMLSGGAAEHTMVAELLGVPCKARADYINIDKGYIADVKTTSFPADVDNFRDVVRRFHYDLSAAFYCDIAYRVYNKIFDFYFIVLSKSDFNCEVYKASTETLSAGAGFVTQGLVLYKQCKASGIWDHKQPASNFDSRDYEILEV